MFFKNRASDFALTFDPNSPQQQNYAKCYSVPEGIIICEYIAELSFAVYIYPS